jgi:Ca2+-binding RTX toxin-like protein
MNNLLFKNATPTSGINYQGEAWGVAWGDYNNDQLPDLWVSNHVGTPRLYKNQGSGIFLEVTQQVLGPIAAQDYHGALWSDVDNDGDQDLLQLLGANGGAGSNGKLLFINTNNKLIDRAPELGVDYPLSRGRMPLVFDLNQDQRLDIFLGATDRPDGQAPATIFRQTPSGKFKNIGSTLNTDFSNAKFAQISHLNGDDQLNLIVTRGVKQSVYEISNGTLVDKTNAFGLGRLNESDFAIADFNGDLKPDIFQVIRSTVPEFFQTTPQEFKTFFNAGANQTSAQGVDFQTQGDLKFEISRLPLENIFIGENGVNPSGSQFTLSLTSPRVLGIKPFQVGEDRGLYIGFDSATQTWKVRWSSPQAEEIFTKVTSTASVRNLNPVGINPVDAFKKDLLYINRNGKFEVDFQAGINAPTAATGVTTGDFDNDGDIDIFVVTGTRIGNPSDVLYENLGNGKFKQNEAFSNVITDKFGAATSVTTVDANLDGFLDLFVANGGDFLGQARDILEKEGSYELLLNQGNSNNWLQMDLEGRYSNRDGIGTQVLITDANGLTQYREQNGGGQRRTQNSTRLHVGLGNATGVNTLDIRWSSGVQQVLRNIAVNQILTVLEGIGDRGADTILGSALSEVLSGNQGNDQIRGNQGDDQIRGNLGQDGLRGDDGNDTLNGNTDNDFLTGGSGNDRLLGEVGNDNLVGASGLDTLTGGSGQDSFGFTRPTEGIDLITDFKPAEDRITISRIGFGGNLSLGLLKADQFVLGTSAGDQRDRFVYNINTGGLYFDVDGSGGDPQILIATVENRISLQASNIRII